MRTVPRSTRYLVTVLGLPVLVVVVGLTLTAASWSELPPVVARHWGPDGVDGTQGRLAFTVTAAVIVLVFGALLGQRGVSEASAATLSPWVFLTGVVAGTALTALAWLLNPVQPRPQLPVVPVPPDAPRLSLADGERLVWFGWTASARWIGWIALALAVLGCVVAVTAAPWAAIGPAIAIVILLLSAHPRVVVDAEGLHVTSAGFLRWVSLPMDEISYAERSELHALRDFGGLGLRFRTDERAFVTRSGEALRVVQRDGRRTYVSMDDAEEAAAVLNGLVSRDVRS